MEITFLDQSLTFCIAFAAGAALCVLYDLFRILRLAARWSKAGVFVQDVLYWTLCGFVTFCLCIVRCSGEVRGFVLLGELLGWTLCRVTLSRLILAAAQAVLNAAKRLAHGVSRVLLRPLGRLLIRTGRFVGKIAQNLKKFLKKHLQRPRDLLYNHIKIKRGAKAAPSRVDGSSCGGG